MIQGKPQEIAALVLALQERLNVNMNEIYNYINQRYAGYFEKIEQNQKPPDGTQ